MPEELTRDRTLDPSREVRAERRVNTLVEEYERIEVEKEKLWRKLRALDAINPIGGFTEERWREFDAEREARRRMIAEVAQQAYDEAAPA